MKRLDYVRCDRSTLNRPYFRIRRCAVRPCTVAEESGALPCATPFLYHHLRIVICFFYRIERLGCLDIKIMAISFKVLRCTPLEIISFVVLSSSLESRHLLLRPLTQNPRWWKQIKIQRRAWTLLHLHPVLFESSDSCILLTRVLVLQLLDL